MENLVSKQFLMLTLKNIKIGNLILCHFFHLETRQKMIHNEVLEKSTDSHGVDHKPCWLEPKPNTIPY